MDGQETQDAIRTRRLVRVSLDIQEIITVLNWKANPSRSIFVVKTLQHLPDNVEVVDVYYAPEMRSWSALLCHSSFEKVPDNDVIPALQQEFARIEIVPLEQVAGK